MGSFGQAMRILKQRGLVEPLREYIQVGVQGSGGAQHTWYLCTLLRRGRGHALLLPMGWDEKSVLLLFG